MVVRIVRPGALQADGFDAFGAHVRFDAGEEVFEEAFFRFLYGSAAVAFHAAGAVAAGEVADEGFEDHLVRNQRVLYL